VTDYPKVRITNPSLAGYRTTIELDGVDISRWCQRVEVVSSYKDANLVRIDLLAGSLDIEMEADDELVLGEAREALLMRHGWTPPSRPEERTEATS
jgi:hypothetical protein